MTATVDQIKAGNRAHELSRLPKGQVAAVLRRRWAEQGVRHMLGEPPERWGKDELISEVLRAEGLK